MPGTARKTSEPRITEPKNTITPEDPDTNPDTPETDPITDTPEDDTEPETNPVVIPEGWEAVPEEDGGGIRPTTVPWAGYENA